MIIKLLLTGFSEDDESSQQLSYIINLIVQNFEELGKRITKQEVKVDENNAAISTLVGKLETTLAALVEEKFGQLDKKVEKLENNFDVLGKGITKLEVKGDGNNVAISTLVRKLETTLAALVEEKLGQLDKKVEKLENNFGVLGETLDTKFEKIEEKISNLDESSAANIEELKSSLKTDLKDKMEILETQISNSTLSHNALTSSIKEEVINIQTKVEINRVAFKNEAENLMKVNEEGFSNLRLNIFNISEQGKKFSVQLDNGET